MNTRCPQCQTEYKVDSDALLAAGGKARCHHCGTVFNAFDLGTPPPGHGAKPRVSAGEELQDLPRNNRLDDFELVPDASGPPPDSPPELPFEVPDDLPTLEPDSHAALQPPGDERAESGASPWWRGLILLLLLIVLAMQVAWFQRDILLRHPAAQPLCQWLDCSVAERRNPSAFAVIERQLGADPVMPGALRLHVRFRNTAPYPQPLPGLQLSLFDNSGGTLARRLFSVDEYLFPSPAKNALAGPQEVFTIELLLEDPGARASGFSIDFL